MGPKLKISYISLINSSEWKKLVSLDGEEKSFFEGFLALSYQPIPEFLFHFCYFAACWSSPQYVWRLLVFGKCQQLYSLFHYLFRDWVIWKDDTNTTSTMHVQPQQYIHCKPIRIFCYSGGICGGPIYCFLNASAIGSWLADISLTLHEKKLQQFY